MNLSAILTKAEALLQGEPARLIGYGAAAVVVLVVAVANRLGYAQLGPGVDLPTALVATGAAIGLVVGAIESIRRYVYSPATVTSILAEQAAPVTPLPHGSEPG